MKLRLFITRPTEGPPRFIRQILTAFSSFQKGFVNGVAASADVGSGLFAAKNFGGSSDWALQSGPTDNVTFIVNPITQQVVDRLTATLNPGQQLQLRPLNGGPTQQWILQTVTDPTLLANLNSTLPK